LKSLPLSKSRRRRLANCFIAFLPGPAGRFLGSNAESLPNNRIILTINLPLEIIVVVIFASLLNRCSRASRNFRNGEPFAPISRVPFVSPNLFGVFYEEINYAGVSGALRGNEFAIAPFNHPASAFLDRFINARRCDWHMKLGTAHPLK